MNRIVATPGKLVLWLATWLAVIAVAASDAHAANVPTSLDLSWLTTCMTGKLSLAVNGVTVGSFDIAPTLTQCDCNVAETSVTLDDTDTRWAINTPGCNIYTVTFSGLDP